MINALRRFVSVRRCPLEVWSDNGQHLTSAENEIKEARKNGIFGRYTITARREASSGHSPSASHKRMVQSTKRVLNTLLQEQLVAVKMLTTVMAEAVNIVR